MSDATGLLVAGAMRIDDDGALASVSIRIRDGRMAEVSDAPLTPQAGEAVLDARGELVAPGLVNAHTHSTLAVTRGTTDLMDHPGFMWTNQADTVGRSAEEIEAVTTLAAADLSRQGITGVLDHAPEQNATRATIAPIVAAWRRSGMRVSLALRIFDGAYDDIGKGEGSSSFLKARGADELIEMAEGAIEEWHRPLEGLKVYPAPSNSERCSDALLRACHELAERNDTGVHAHFLETKVQRDGCLAERGVTPVVRLDRLGVLSPRASFAHCVWVDEADIALFAERGVVVVHNPHSNAKLGVGLMPLVAMLEAGCTVALGTDGAATNDTHSMHETMALSLLLPRATGTLPRERWPTSTDALGMATIGGAAALLENGRIGSIGEGWRADLTFYATNDLALAPANDVRQQLVFAARGSSVTRTMVAGRTIYERGRWPTLDVEGAVAVAEAMRARRQCVAPSPQRRG